jgi:asparagine synthase (glutamine-hydrolysing)
MCGIAGLISFAEASPQDLTESASAMAETLAHRGPDDCGSWSGDGVGLGHRRLAVVGLGEGGAQPMTSRSGRWVITYNGEIYNYRELRAELISAGVRFRGESDTEVLLESVDRWGLDRTLGRLDGMFAFGLWDREHRALTLVRDRFGEKPLYYGRFGPTLLFGSELRALRAHPQFSPKLSLSGAAAYFDFGHVPGALTVYESVSKVEPGTYMTISRAGEIARTIWWDAVAAANESAARPFAGTRGEAAQELRRRLLDSVRRRLVADVPVGAMLSGGLDSSAIVLLAASVSSHPVRTFSVGFENRNYDESPHARSVAELIGTDHRTLMVSDRDAFELVPRLPDLWDEPFADSSQIPTFFVSELARRHVTVALTGDGGDELFGGYDRYRHLHRMIRVRGLIRWTPELITRRLGEAGGRGAEILGRDRLARRLRKASRFGGTADIPGLYRKFVTLPRPAELRDHEDRHPGDDSLHTWGSWPGGGVSQALGVDTVAYLPDDILVKVDRATMANSLEGRIPFLDAAVFDFAWSLRDEDRWRGRRGKAALREMLRQELPATVIQRPKQGFGIPLGEWLRSGLRTWAEDTMSGAPPTIDLVDRAQVDRLWREHVGGGADHGSFLWTFLMFESWRQRHHGDLRY